VRVRKGFLLIEVLIGLVIVSFFAVAMAAVNAASGRVQREAEELLAAANLAEQVLEDLRALTPAQITALRAAVSQPQTRVIDGIRHIPWNLNPAGLNNAVIWVGNHRNGDPHWTDNPIGLRVTILWQDGRTFHMDAVFSG